MLPAGQATAMAPPVRTDDQILPRIRAFTASSTIPSVYIQQFWDKVQYDKKAGCYRCQLDEQWNLSNVVTNDMFQPSRELTMIINLCLTGKTFGFERPRASVLQILWGIVKRAHIDYAERIWEEFTQSIHTFIDDKRNLSWHTTAKKKATLIVIPSIWFTKLIIHHLQKRHKFYPRPDSPLHLPNEEPVLGYLKFSGKDTKREVFGMPIPGSDPDSPAPKPTKPARKPKSTAPKAPPRSSILTPVTSAQPAPTSAPVVAENADLQKALAESMKSTYDAPRGLLPPVVIREPESEKYQPLLEPKKKSLADQYIFQRRTFIPTGSSGHDEPSYVELGQSESEESEKVVPKADEGGQGKGEGQAGPDPGQAGPDPGNAGAEVLLEDPASSSGTLSSLQHLSKDISFEDLFFSDKPYDADNDKANAETEVESMVSVKIQQDLSLIPQMTSLIIDLTSRLESPKVRQQFTATATETTTTTTTTLPPPPAQQQSTAEAMMMKRIGELEHIMANLIQVNKEIEERLNKHGVRLYMLEQLDIPQQVRKAISEVVMDAIDCAMQVPLRNRFRDLSEADMKEILHQCMRESESYRSHEDHMQLFKALEKSMNRDHSKERAQDLAKARKKKEKSRESPKMPPRSPPHQPPPSLPARPSRASGAPEASRSSQVPPPPPPPSSINQESQSKGSAAPSYSKIAASAEYQAWTMTDIRLRPSISLTPTDQEMDEDMGLDEQA
uniref:Monodehydroascorbate reductase n=1 Tax=Tanacetum cinerariifolium TaxID=118510 RepID=A0A6L2KTG5_TANCI|nr:hypothetical protein [Tanacetum cinerariifolium]